MMKNQEYSIPDDDARIAGQKIRQERLRRGLTQSDMGEMLGLSTSYISSLERGQRRISWNVGKKLFQCFGISCDYMMESGFRTEALPDLVREEEEDSLYPKFRLLLGACNQAELIGCYEMCRNYLSSVRSHARFCNDPSFFDSADIKKDPVFEKEPVSSASESTKGEPDGK